MRRRLYGCAAAALASVVLAPAGSRASVVSIAPAADNTLYEDSAGSLSNGAGEHFFAGRTNFNVLRRGLIRFDIAGAVPAGSVVQSVSLQLHMSRGSSSLAPVTLHRAQQDWGEGTSDAPDEEGVGTGATPGDATWLNTFFPGQLWSVEGGAFDQQDEASTLVTVTGFYSWSSAAMAAQVQSWLDSPAGNFGWFVLADETQFPSAKRFDTRENQTEEFRPVLTVTYVPTPAGAMAMLMGVGLAAGRRRRGS